MTDASLNPAQRRAAFARANAVAIAETAAVLRTAAAQEAHSDPFAGDLAKTQAALLDSVSRHVTIVPREILTEALAVVTAVDRLTGHRRTAGT